MIEYGGEEKRTKRKHGNRIMCQLNTKIKWLDVDVDVDGGIDD